jgi:large subunit ribosomal protein L17
MKHLKQGRKFGRTKDKRNAMLRILLGDLLIKEKITTTEAKAKELKRISEKIISKAKLAKASNKFVRLAALRSVLSVLPKNINVKKIEEIGKYFSNRDGGYTRVIKLPQRKSDGAKMAIIEFVKDNKKDSIEA